MAQAVGHELLYLGLHEYDDGHAIRAGRRFNSQLGVAAYSRRPMGLPVGKLYPYVHPHTCTLINLTFWLIRHRNSGYSSKNSAFARVLRLGNIVSAEFYSVLL